MTNRASEIDKVLAADDENVRFARAKLCNDGLLGLFELSILAFDDVFKEIESLLAGSLKLKRGATAIPSDISMRLFMAVSARHQFLLAYGHLLRGHVTEVFGHVRRAIEASGIAYLAKSKPEIGDLFRDRKREEFRNETRTRMILPRDNALTGELNGMIDEASNRLHNNFDSFATRLTEELHAEGPKYRYKNTIFIHEISRDNLEYFFDTSVWVLRAAQRVVPLLAASFNIEVGAWRETLAAVAEKIERLRSGSPLKMSNSKKPS